MSFTVIGNIVAEWDDDVPLDFSLENKAEETRIEIKLSKLVDICELDFLLALKDYFIYRSNRVGHYAINNTKFNILACLRKISELKLFEIKINKIDETLLLGLFPFRNDFPTQSLESLRIAFNDSPKSSIFAEGIHASDFPVADCNKGRLGNIKSNILAKALTRATCVEVLRLSEEAFENGNMDIGLFSFLSLAFATYCRPNSYRKLTLADLDYRKLEDTWYIWVVPMKHRVHRAHEQEMKIPYKLNKRLALLLQMQRQHVVESYGQLVNKENVRKIALFPSRGLLKNKSNWLGQHAQKNYGQFPTSNEFSNAYFGSIQKILGDQIKSKIGGTILRHTIGTQMAQVGCSAKTIQAVLKHATDHTCQAYVDIFVQGMIDQLSDALQPGFEAHLPVFKRFRSKADSIDQQQAIESEEIKTGRIELTGECGTGIKCEAAPLSCYECHRFIPCWDADHSINLETINLEINKYEKAGLAFKVMADKAKHIKYKIILVMNACDLKRQIHLMENTT